MTRFNSVEEVNGVPETLLPELRSLLEGRRIIKSPDNETILLDDGTILKLYESGSDCCAYAEGSWVINHDNLDAIITNVKLAERSTEVSDTTTHSVIITLLHNQNLVAQAECSANNGNGGFYYSALSMEVANIIGKSKHDRNLLVVKS